MSLCFDVVVDGNTPQRIRCGDAITYKLTVLDEDLLPYTGVITAVLAEILSPVGSTAVPLSPRVNKTYPGLINVLPNAVLEIVFTGPDTDNVAPGLYVVAFKVATPDYGEKTHTRMLRLSPQLLVM